MVQHPAGSLQAAVKTMRWRNFAFSFGILILLGGSMALLVVSTQRAQRLARLQVEFVAGVSHELRTPLTVISSAAQNLKDGIVESTPQVKLYGKLIRDESQRLKGMVEHILDFAAGQQKKPYEPVPLQPTELISEALSMAASLITEFGIEVEQNVSPNLPVVMGERNGLTQSLHNLIVNAIKYRGDHPWLGIRAWTDQKWIRIAVEDRGLGIESTDLPYLFDAFFRGRAVTAAQIHGTGLGLNLAQTFAQAAGGKITVESTPGKGSCFTLHLPAASEADVEVPNLARQIA